MLEAEKRDYKDTMSKLLDYALGHSTTDAEVLYTAYHQIRFLVKEVEELEKEIESLQDEYYENWKYNE